MVQGLNCGYPCVPVWCWNSKDFYVYVLIFNYTSECEWKQHWIMKSDFLKCLHKNTKLNKLSEQLINARKLKYSLCLVPLRQVLRLSFWQGSIFPRYSAFWLTSYIIIINKYKYIWGYVLYDPDFEFWHEQNVMFFVITYRPFLATAQPPPWWVQG